MHKGLIIRIFAGLLAFIGMATAALASEVSIGPPGSPFGMVGITVTEVGRLGIMTNGKEACTAGVAFLDSQGSFLRAEFKALMPGSAQFLDVYGSQAVPAGAQRIEVRPVFLNLPVNLPAAFPPGPCRTGSATLQVFDRGTGQTNVAAVIGADSPGWGIDSPGWGIDSPGWGIIGMTPAETMQLNVVSDDKDSCSAGLGFADSTGNVLNAQFKALRQGHPELLDLAGSQAVPRGQQRVEVRPFLSANIPAGFPPGPCRNLRVTVELFDKASGQTRLLISH